MSYSNF